MFEGSRYGRSKLRELVAAAHGDLERVWRRRCGDLLKLSEVLRLRRREKVAVDMRSDFEATGRVSAGSKGSAALGRSATVGTAYRSDSASLNPSSTNAAAKVRRIQVMIAGREITWFRIAAANSP